MPDNEESGYRLESRADAEREEGGSETSRTKTNIILMSKEKQALSKFLPREPRNISAEDWFYLEPEGLILVHEVYTSHEFTQTDQITIPWAKIRKAIEDFDRAEEKRFQ